MDPEREVRSPSDLGNLETWQSLGALHGVHHEGQTVVCYVCHKEGHKSYECKVKNGGGAKKKEKKQTSKLSNTYTNKVDKRPPHHIS